MESQDAPGHRPTYRSHYVPRTRDGWVAVTVFLVLFALCMPPFTHTIWDRLYPTILGMPFFYSVLFFLYLALIGVLIWAYRRGV